MASSVTFTLDMTGAESVLDAFQDSQVRRIAAAVNSALVEPTMALSKVYVPVATGLLKSTGHAADPQITDGKIEQRFGFGTLYGPAVHEGHRTRKKFLERAAMEVAATAETRLERWLSSH